MLALTNCILSVMFPLKLMTLSNNAFVTLKLVLTIGGVVSTIIIMLAFTNLLLFTSTLLAVVLYPVILTVMLILALKATQLSASTFVLNGTLPFIVNSVTSTALMPPSASVFPVNTLTAKESLITTCAFAIGLLFVLFVTLTSRYHLTVKLFISTGTAKSLGINAILDLLKLTFVNMMSVAFAVRTMSL